MPNISIRNINSADLILLQKISKQTFSETFLPFNSPENINSYLENELSVKKLSTELANKNSTFYFAEVDTTPVGYLKINVLDAQTEIKEGNALEIERIYVLKEFHGAKVGQKLFEKAMELAIQKSVDYIWLGVWEQNLKAIRFYKKNGFVIFNKHVFKLGEDEQTDLMMKLEL